MKTNKIIMITGANTGIGKDTARQLALIKDTEKIYLACRNKVKAEAAKISLEKLTGRSIFEILIMDVSNPDSVKKAVSQLNEPIDALIMNAGGIGGKTPEKLTKEGVTTITASNLLGHVVLLDELLKENKLKNIALYASSEAARGIKQTGMKRPNLTTSSVDEFIKVFDGSYFGNNFDAMQVYGVIKYGGTLWMSAMARKYPEIKFISMSPGGTRGTDGMNDLPFIKRILFKYIGMPIFMPLLGLSHSLEKGAKRFVDGINNENLKNGVFYASKENVLTGSVVDQSEIFPDLTNITYQNNAYKAIHSFIN
ncbi:MULTISPECIES: SDR family NAD(P)-dependent oxidoreductase [unclassified Tenacibaculum]|uniref:SDR family NAD(P)-dependent oxidoreductase n=1 Tax=unclassified Tenacibaculum TaxID=2635139 RepID=UPI001F3D75B5|nr:MULTISPECIES: SDR family NAD(P)-dependent oxidoreductase [unclassified Tenacibaculum]MCF2874134.1 SDR family NAD(P)-dependent oxidoreductase [Tenacibaculum sp. Cn5-1]MCF2934715.1 SDR family NAD(P)-dependent oxidoreductase [Tenacibaculum sp. Cn5-34]MCG7510925.1 SDR family NAD(P)-dependent oxidoreductase [Tenacibaculum sp. Cn5-46]